MILSSDKRSEHNLSCFFDIKKPFPISWIDKNIGGGLGIMLDDIVAAIPPIIIVNIWYLVYAS